MAAPRSYPNELRERAIRAAVDLRRDPATRKGALARVAEQVGMNPETLRTVNQAEVDAGDRQGTTTSDARRLAERKREVREPRRSCGARQLPPRRTRSPTTVIVEYIDTHKDQFGVEPDLEGAAGRLSTSYAAESRPRSARAVSDAEVSEATTAEGAASSGVHGCAGGRITHLAYCGIGPVNAVLCYCHSRHDSRAAVGGAYSSTQGSYRCGHDGLCWPCQSVFFSGLEQALARRRTLRTG